MRKDSIIPLVLLIVTAVLLILKPAQAPPLWFDEGWDLSVARNWVETGQYAQLLMGNPISASMLNTGLPAIAPIALSFRLFGVGIWQGRVSGGLFVLATLALLYYLARHLYNPQVAIGPLRGNAADVCSPGDSSDPDRPAGIRGDAITLLYFGRICVLPIRLAQTRHLHASSDRFLGTGTDDQTAGRSFSAVSLVIPLIVTLFGRRWKSAALLAGGLSGSLLVYGILNWLQRRFIYGENLIPAPIPDLYSVTAIVPLARVRLAALLVMMAFGLPTALGLGHAAWKFMRRRDFTGLDQGKEVVRLALLILGGSWLTWYVGLSVGWPRYLFPPVFIGSLFVAAFLQRLFRGTPSLVAQRKGMRLAEILLAVVFLYLP